jgi:hypothetical protein
LLALYSPVQQVYDPFGPLGDAVIMGDNDERLALLMQTVEQKENLAAAFRIQIAGWLISENHQGVIRQRTGNCRPLLLTTA